MSERGTAAPTGAAGNDGGVSVPGSEEWIIASAHVGGALRVTLFEAVPPADEPVPLVVLLDGAGSMLAVAEFLRTTRLLTLFTVPPVAVVAVTVDADDFMSYLSTRFRDFTPTVWDPPAEMIGPIPLVHGTGGAPRMLAAIVDEVLPSVRSRLAVDDSAIGIAGHCLGGLFAAWAWLERPDVFSRLLASSPSLWWDDGALLRAPIAARPTGHRAFVAAGEHEQGPVDSIWPPFMRSSQELSDELAMVSRSIELAEGLRTSGADVEAIVVPGEHHLTVFPAASTRGLRHLYFA